MLSCTLLFKCYNTGNVCGPNNMRNRMVKKGKWQTKMWPTSVQQSKVVKTVFELGKSRNVLYRVLEAMRTIHKLNKKTSDSSYMAFNRQKLNLKKSVTTVN